MKKEVVVAVLLGLILGLIITYGVYRAQFSSSSEQEKTLKQSPEPTTSPELLSSLVIHSPADESIVDTKEVTVAGTADPNNFIIIFTNDASTITSADTTGAFSVKTSLEAGSNIIEVNSVNEDGQTVTQELVVIYTTQNLEVGAEDLIASPTPTPSASPKAPNAR